jgi:hypothetical protein
MFILFIPEQDLYFLPIPNRGSRIPGPQLELSESRYRYRTGLYISAELSRYGMERFLVPSECIFTSVAKYGTYIVQDTHS